MKSHRSNKSGFTLVEIMIVVAIIGLLATIAVPGFIRARKNSQAKKLINAVRQIEAGIDQWALEKGKDDSATFTSADIAPYIKGGFPSFGAVIEGSYEQLNTVGDPNRQIEVFLPTPTQYTEFMGDMTNRFNGMY